MTCADCGKEYERYRIEFVGRIDVGSVFDSGATLHIGKDSGLLKSEDADLCSKCMLKAIGSGIVHGGSISTGTVWVAETDGGD